MNNKMLGTEFERQFVKILANCGYWVHFLNPDRAGAQPFDVIAVRDGKAYAIDCKTSTTRRFTMDRLEDNQILAFEKWLNCGNTEPLIAIKYKSTIRLLWYTDLKALNVVKIDDLIEFYPNTSLEREVKS